MSSIQIFLVCFTACIVANLCTWYLVKSAFRSYNKDHQDEQKSFRDKVLDGLKEIQSKLSHKES